jgi:Flp pilus assembly protein TadG
MAVPVFLLILLGMLEFGFAFSHHLTMEYASREGARIGATLNNGTKEFLCGGSNDQNVDNQIIAAVQRVLTGTGSQVKLAQVSTIHIYRASSTGQESAATTNVWVPGAASQTVGGVALQFHRSGGVNWNACSRDNTSTSKTDPVDSIGVSIQYDYQFVTPLSGLMGLTGGGSIHMTDRSVMALNPDPL